VLRAEGNKTALVLQAEAQKQSAILRSEGEAQALVTVQSAQAKAIELVFGAVNGSNPTTEAMAYQYLQMLPKLAENPANKVIVVPTDYAGLAGAATTLLSVATTGNSVKANGMVPVSRSTVSTSPPGTTIPALPQAFRDTATPPLTTDR